MPIWLRRFTFQEIKTFYEREKEEYDKATGKGQTLKTPDQLMKSVAEKTPEQKPTYTSKVTKRK